VGVPADGISVLAQVISVLQARLTDGEGDRALIPFGHGDT
jgi:hypothetical protein